jgi:hypothetical protein
LGRDVAIAKFDVKDWVLTCLFGGDDRCAVWIPDQGESAFQRSLWTNAQYFPAQGFDVLGCPIKLMLSLLGIPISPLNSCFRGS